MGRLHYSSAPKYTVKKEPTYEEQCFVKWADQAFDPEAEKLGGHDMVYEAFLDKDGRPPLLDDGDGASELNSELSSSSAATEDLDEYPTLRRVARERLLSPPSPVLSAHSVELGTNEFDDFVRVEVPPTDTLAPDTRPLATHRPSSPLRQSITSSHLDDLPDHPSSDIPEAMPRRVEEERLFTWYQPHTPAQQERERQPYVTRIPPRPDWVMPQTRRTPGHSQFLPPISTRLEGQRIPLANRPGGVYIYPRPRSASYSEVLAAGTRAPERWVSTVDGTVVSNRVVAQR